jgi:hypothetical protein
MRFLSHIESKLQTKSAGVKAQYAFLVAFVVTGVIGAVWVSTLPARIAQISVSKQDGTGDSSAPNEFNDLLNDTKSQLGNIIETTKTDVLENVQPATNLDMLGEPVPAQEATFSDNKSVPTNLKTPGMEINTAPASEVDVEPTAPRMILIGTTTNREPG